MTTDAFGSDDTRLALVVKTDGLMSAVGAGYIASSAADTELAVNLRKDHGLAVEIGRHNEVLKLLTH